MILEEQQELIGILQSFKKENNQYELRFTCTKEIEFPSTAFPQINLTFLIGKRIGIVNFNGYYKVRIIEEKK